MPVEPRLYVILAREAPVGVVFRRGPSKQVLLVSWDTATDTFVHGQWFKGRVYEDRCDLSPSGDLLVYFAADQRRTPYSTWFAVSRPPYLTALALWAKGDSWGGGGLFEDQTTLTLDHDELVPTLGSLPSWLHVREFQRGESWTQDGSPWSVRIQRDGWRLTSVPGKLAQSRDVKGVLRWEPPQVWEKEHPLTPGRYVLRMTHVGLHEERAWYVAEYEVIDGSNLERLGHIEWADWDRNGDLLFAMKGALYRLRQRDGVLPPLEDADVIADFSGLTFEPREPSEEAKRWPGR